MKHGMSKYLILILCVICVLLSGCSMMNTPAYEPSRRISDAEASEQAHVYAVEQSAQIEIESQSPLDLRTTISSESLSAPTEPVQELSLTLHFETGDTQLSSAEITQLESAAQVLNSDPLAKAIIEGHTDSVGEAEYNVKLSRERAEKLCALLASEYGVAPEQLRVEAHGEELPLADNGSIEGRRMNRRVTLALFPVWKQPGGGSADEAYREQKTAQAIDLLENGDPQSAYDILSELVRVYPEDDTINFQMGMASFKLGNFPMALFAFERILMRRPDLDRVRLELAVTYSAMEQYEHAKREFETVLSHNPPEQVQKNIETYLAAMESGGGSVAGDTDVSGKVSVSWFHDTNVNVGPRNKEIGTSIGTVLLTDDSSPRKDEGIMASASMSVTHNVSDTFALFTEIGHSQKRHFHENNFDLITYNASPGLRVVMDEHLLQVQGRYQHLDYDASPLMDIYGPRMTYAYMATENVQLITDMFYELRDHRVESERDSHYFSGGEYLRVFWGERGNEFMTGVRLFTERALESRFTNRGIELMGYVDFKFDHEITPYLMLSYRGTEWDGRHSALAADDRFDQLVRMQIGATVELFLEGLTLGAALEVLNNTSTFDASSYNKYTPSISLSYEF